MGAVTRVAMLQLCATSDVETNLACAERLARAAAEQNAQAIFLPEAFAFLGRDQEKQLILETLDQQGPILTRMQNLARETTAHLILGGFHEKAGDGRSFNTCIHLTPEGMIAATYRKIHLFDVCLADGTELYESRKTEPGCEAAVTQLPFGPLGLSICYDLRFPYLYQQLVDMGAIAVTVPSAFTATTGKAHWHTLLRARAIECQCYVLAPAQHGSHSSTRRSFGHSVIIDPWGTIIAEVDQGDGFAIADIDPAEVARVRRELPSLTHRRTIA